MIQRKHLHILSLIMAGFILGWISNTFTSTPKTHNADESLPFANFYKLGLNPEVINEIKIIHDVTGEKHKQLKESLDQYEKKFNKDIENSKDEQKLRASFSSFLQRRNKLEEMRFETMLNIHRHLTLQQIKKLRSFGPPGPKPKKR